MRSEQQSCGQAGEVYARWLQYCSLGTVTRMHSAPSMSRLPWKFGTQAESVAKNFLSMRRSLAPTLTAAARQVTLDGTPLVRRCDLIWPQHVADGANSSAQYMLADDLLVRPIDPFDGVPPENASFHTYSPVDGKYNRDATVWLPPGEWHDAFSGEVLQGGRTLRLSNQSVERMPLFHRGGGVVVTASGSDASGWEGLVAHVWPTRASFAAAATAGGELAPPLTRSLYAPSVADPDGSAPPVASIVKTERRGGFSLDFSADEGSPSQLWTVRVHVPVADADVATAQLRCADVDVALTAHVPSALHSVPFAGRHAPEQAPNAVLEGTIAVDASSRVLCTFGLVGNDDRRDQPGAASPLKTTDESVNLGGLGPGKGGWQTMDPGALGIDAAKLKAATTELHSAASVRNCTLIVRNGYIIHEYYDNASNAESVFESDSMGKASTAALIGLLELRGLVDLDTPIAKYNVSRDQIAPVRTGGQTGPATWNTSGVDYFGDVTLRHLLSQASGYGRVAPGSYFTYDSDAYIEYLSYVIGAVTGEDPVVWATRCV